MNTTLLYTIGCITRCNYSCIDKFGNLTAIGTQYRYFNDLLNINFTIPFTTDLVYIYNDTRHELK